MAGETFSSALSSAITFKVQQKVLENLRAELVYANREFAQEGTFQPGFDTIKWVSMPDLSVATTPLTEGTPPTAVALTITTTTLSTSQYGSVVTVTDLAKLKSPIALVEEGSNRLTRQAAETIDQITRDVVAAGGTVFYPTGSANTVRTDIAVGEVATATDLRKLAATMFKNKIKPFADGMYHMIVSPGQMYDLMADTATGGFIDSAKYTTLKALTSSEVGAMQGFRIFRAVNAPTFSSTTTVHAALAMGNLPGWGAGDLQTLQAYHAAPGGQADILAQQEKLGWKVDFGVAVLSNARYYRYETAATTI